MTKSMTLRERILSVYRGDRPDVVPYMLDLSHWFYQKHRLPWDLSRSFDEPEYRLIDYHRQVGAGFYMPNLGSFYAVHFSPEVEAITEKRQRRGVPEIAWRLVTPLGSIERARIWEEKTYAWGISQWGIHSKEDLRVFAYAMSRRRFTPLWDRYRAWVDCVGDTGVVYLSAGYSAMGYLLNYWMGIEQTVYGSVDFSESLREAVDAVNANNLELVDLLCESPAEVIIMGDNFSSDIQPPSFFAAWSQAYYLTIARNIFIILHNDIKQRVTRLRGGKDLF